MADYITFQPKDVYQSKTYTGTGSSNAISLGMQPDLVWIKNRDATDFHVLTDSVRGVTKQWFTNNEYVEATQTENVNSFDADGFTVGTQDQVNTDTEDFVSWSWKMGTTSGLTGGTITPTAYSINATAGQSIIAYTGAGAAGTVPHGLGKTPAMIIVKNLGQGNSGMVYHYALNRNSSPEDYYMKIDGTGAQEDAYGSGAWNDTAPTSTVFSVGGNDHTSGSFNYIAYCFTNIPGYSSFTSYAGNGDANGPFVWCGFRPAFVMVKRITGSSGNTWEMWDDKRSGSGGVGADASSNVTFNVTDRDLVADNDTAETSDPGDDIDILAQGFKIRGSNDDCNANQAPYLTMAFAASPLVSSNTLPGVAR